MHHFDTFLVHIGKCAGSTIRRELILKGIKFHEVHISKVKFRKEKRYILAIRNPISRYISAFNWRYKLVVERGLQGNRFLGEKDRLVKYKTANFLAENIYDGKGDLQIDFQKEEYYFHHIREDINFYIGDFLRECPRENIIAVLATETLAEDMLHYFNIESINHLKKNKQEIKLSDLARKNLIKYFEKDYDCIEKLNEMSLLDKKQYEYLSSENHFS